MTFMCLFMQDEALVSQDERVPIALWAFCHPTELCHLDSYLRRQKGIRYGLKRAGDHVFSEEDMYECQKELAGITLVKQHGGDKVVVPPGLAHAVVNLSACMKIAWDVLDHKELSQCIHAWRHFICPWFKGEPNHVNVDHVLVQGVYATSKQ